MPTPTTYTYSIQTDFPSQAVAPDRLTSEIQASAIVTALSGITTYGDDCSVIFKDPLSVGDETILDGIVAVHGGVPLPQNVAMKVEAAAPFPTVKHAAPKLTLITPNWCNKTTWYPQSIYVTDEVATDSGDHTVYTLAHVDVIDTYHGKVSFEDYMTDDDGHSYRVTVKVDGVTKTEQDPHTGTGGDYTINYATGAITFLSAQGVSAVITATYHYADGSGFTIKPAAGKKIIISAVEAQLSEDTTMNDSMSFQAYGFVDVFAPQLMPGVPSGTKIPLGNPLIYKTICDIINDANHAYVAYPALGGSNWRAVTQKTYIMAWDYIVGATELYATYGMEVRVSLVHNAPYGGAYATATFYCTSSDENL